MRKGVLSTRTTRSSRSSGEITYHYHSFYLQSGRAVRKGVLSTGTTRSSRSSGEIAYHYSYLQFGRAVRKGCFDVTKHFFFKFAITLQQ